MNPHTERLDALVHQVGSSRYARVLMRHGQRLRSRLHQPRGHPNGVVLHQGQKEVRADYRG
jgi:hypothetical protein